MYESGGGGGIYVVSTDAVMGMFFSVQVHVWVGNYCPWYRHGTRTFLIKIIL